MTESIADRVSSSKIASQPQPPYTATALIEMLGVKGAPAALLDVARTSQHHACLMCRKPRQVTPFHEGALQV